MSAPTKYQQAMAEVERTYGLDGVYAFEACCLTEADCANMHEVCQRVEAAMHDMGSA